MSKGPDKLYVLVLGAGPFFFIMYDLIYKIKLNKSDNNTVDDTAFKNFVKKIYNFIPLVAAGSTCAILLFIFLLASDLTIKIILLPFLYCSICISGQILGKIYKKEKIEKLFKKGYVLFFLFFWFGFLTFFTAGLIEQEGSYQSILYTIPFWIVGIFMVYKFLIKK